MTIYSFLLSLLFSVAVLSSKFDAVGAVAEVFVESLSKTDDPSVPVTKDYRYESDVTLYIEGDDGERTPSGWSTRVEDGAATEQPFTFQPGVNLIEGWTIGVLQMEEGERALLHVPYELGYGDRSLGDPIEDFYIPAKSNLLFDIKILGKVEDDE